MSVPGIHLYDYVPDASLASGSSASTATLIAAAMTRSRSAVGCWSIRAALVVL